MPEDADSKILQEAYVNHRKEDKLRALGVDEQMPRGSPTLSVMSRQGSSQSSSMLRSPALTSSWRLGPCPPALYGAANSPPYVGNPGFSQNPMAHPFHDPSLISPSQLSLPSEPQIPGTWSPQMSFASQQGSRVASPQINGHMQAFGHAAPSMSPIGLSNVSQVSKQPSIHLLARTREQQGFLQIQQSEQQQQSLHLQPILQQSSPPSLGSPQNGERNLQPLAHHYQADIVGTNPEDHRQNPDGILQKGVDEAKAGVSYLMDGLERQDCCKAIKIDKRLDEHRAKSASSKNVTVSPQHFRANANLGAKVIADPVVSQSEQYPSTHSPKSSQLNVNAPKFQPGKLRDFGAFSFLDNKQTHQLTQSENLILPYPDVGVRALDGVFQHSEWNFAAPEFMPKDLVTASVPFREFSFSALRPSLRPDAPAFEPSDSRCASGHQPSSERNTVQSTEKIFSNVNFSEVIKPPTSKAIPVIKPIKETTAQSRSDETLDGQEDESGRITQADGRQKRMRYVV